MTKDGQSNEWCETAGRAEECVRTTDWAGAGLYMLYNARKFFGGHITSSDRRVVADHSGLRFHESPEWHAWGRKKLCHLLSIWIATLLMVSVCSPDEEFPFVLGVAVSRLLLPSVSRLLLPSRSLASPFGCGVAGNVHGL